ncbi:MFS transporter [bacterium]|nr:MFS transporter [bacterium]
MKNVSENAIFLKRVFQNRNLTFLWIGQTISQSGDSIFQIGLLWLVLELSGSESVTGLVAMASYLPAVLLSLFAGVVADRFNHRTIMLTADAIRSFAVLIVPLAWYFDLLSPGLLAGVAFITAISATFFNPARDSLIPQIVPQAGLLRANSLVQTSWQFSLLLGPALAAGLLHSIGKIHLFTADAFAYGLSFFFVYLINLSVSVTTTSPASNQNKTYRKKYDIGLSEILEGLRYTVREPVIFPLLLITIADNIFIMGPALVGTPVLVKKNLMLGAEAYALVQACYAVGMLLGTLALLKWGGRFRKGTVLLVGMILDGITFVPIYFVSTLPVLAIVIVIHSLAIPMLTVSRTSLIQQIIPANMTGRIFALVNLSVVGMSAISAGLTGYVLEVIDAPLLFLIIGFGGGLCGVLGLIFATKLRQQQ